MNWIKSIILLLFLVSLNGCLDNTEEPDPKPQTPPPAPQVVGE
jgi:hypothetical protein